MLLMPLSTLEVIVYYGLRYHALEGVHGHVVKYRALSFARPLAPCFATLSLYLNRAPVHAGLLREGLVADVAGERLANVNIEACLRTWRDNGFESLDTRGVVSAYHAAGVRVQRTTSILLYTGD